MFCCDPGLVSGVAILSWKKSAGIEKVESFECSLGEVGEAASVFLDHFPRQAAEVVVERFIITPRTGELTNPDWSLKVCGAIEWLVYKHWEVDGAETVVYQTSSEAKRFVNNDRLRKAGVWHRGGAGHANDALRHGLYRYARLGVLDAWDDVD